MEKLSSNEGWIPASADEGWSLGYARELKNFIECVREKRTPESDLDLALDVTLAIYAGYVSADERGREVEVPRV
jgi:predicted dehydrogenase